MKIRKITEVKRDELMLPNVHLPKRKKGQKKYLIWCCNACSITQLKKYI